MTDVFTSAASLGVDVLLSNDVLVSILDPGHDLLVGTHIWTKAVNSCSNEALLDKLHSVSSSNSLQLSLGNLSWVNLNSSLTSSEGHIGDGELEGHETSQSLHLLQINVFGVTSTSLGWQCVSGMLSSIFISYYCLAELTYSK